MDPKNKVMKIKETMKHETRKKTMERNLNLPIDVIHGIQEDRGEISWIHDNTVNRDMPIFI